MGLGQIYSLLCFLYLIWTIIATKHNFYHRVSSALLFLTVPLWQTGGIYSCLSIVVFILIVALSPVQVLWYNKWYANSEDNNRRENKAIHEIPSAGIDDAYQDKRVDIFVVHGLASHYLGAWTPDHKSRDEAKQDPTSWLHFLARDADLRARVMTFSHDSRWARGASSMTVSDYGNTFLKSIRAQRNTAQARNRPLVLIGHSFGGLIIKQMLVNAAAGDAEDQLMLQMTCGLIFMGTPHRGAQMTIVGKLISLLGFWDGSSTVLLEFLSVGSELNKQLHKNFMSLLPKICGYSRTLCIRETIPERQYGFPIVEIVDEDSAVIDGCPYMAVARSHMGIHRISSEEDDTYKEIVRYISDWALHDEKTPDDEEILRSLSFPTMESRYDQISASHQGTCDWILEHEKFQLWQQGAPGVLWLKGNPGSGKSTLMAFLLDAFGNKEAAKIKVVLYHFFNGRLHGLERSLEGLVRSLLHQLYLKVYASRQQLRPQLKEKGILSSSGQCLKWHQQDLENAFVAGLRAVGSMEVVILLDALDEADSNEIRSITKFLRKIQTSHDTTDRSERLYQPQLCISCRHYPAVASIPGPEIHVEHHNRPAIQMYMEQNLQIGIIPAARSYGNDWENLVSDLTRTASTSFLWAAIVVDLAFKCVPEGGSMHELRERLSELPTELDDLYKYLLTEVVEPRRRDKTFLLLQWVCLAKRPMSVKELRYAFAMEGAPLSQPGLHCADTKEFVETDDRMNLQITAISGGLVEVVHLPNDQDHADKRTDFVQVVHQSVMDFLLYKGLSFLSSTTKFFTEGSLVAAELRSQGMEMERLHLLQSSTDFSMIRGASHYRLFLACLCYLVLEEPDFSASWSRYANNDYAEEDSLLSDYPLLAYATACMFYHAAYAQDFLVQIGSDGNNLIELLDTGLETWIRSYRTMLMPWPSFPEADSTLLQIASRYNLVGVVRSILDVEQLQVNKADYGGNTALHYASRGGHSELVELLLKHGADSNIENKLERTPLVEATNTERCRLDVYLGIPWQRQLPATDGHLRSVKLLLANGCRVDHGTDSSGNALYEASKHGSVPLVELLLNSGATINAKSGEYGTALASACFQGHQDIVDLLISRGADINATAGRFTNALMVALTGRGPSLVDTLLAAGASVRAPLVRDSPLYRAVTRGHREIFFKLYAAGGDDPVHEEMLDVLITACTDYGHPDVLRCLLQTAKKHGFQIPCLSECLHKTSREGNEEKVKHLLEVGMDVNQQIYVNGEPSSALEIALYRGYHGIVQMLIDHGADVNGPDGVYGGCLEAALYSRTAGGTTKETLVRTLLAAGVDVKTSNYLGETALDIARSCGMGEVVELLIQAGSL